MMPCNEWPVDTGCCDEWSTYSTEVQYRALNLAIQTLRMLTAYRVGGCPVTVRPCMLVDCSHGIGYYPQNWAGVWSNSGGVSPCEPTSEVVLPGPIGRVDEVLVDGVAVVGYTVHNGTKLVRTDGLAWPLTQDMSKDSSQVGTFAVTYLKGIVVDELGMWVAGIMACEFAKGCSGSKACRLPAGTTALLRAGVSITVTSGAFPGGKTGIREVDAWVMRYNPRGRVQESTIWTPETAVRGYV